MDLEMITRHMIRTAHESGDGPCLANVVGGIGPHISSRAEKLLQRNDRAATPHSTT